MTDISYVGSKRLLVTDGVGEGSMDERTSVEDKLGVLSARIQDLEDRLAIYDLMATYGPAVDGAARDVAGGLWTEDGVYDAGVGLFEGSAGVSAMVEGPMHQGIISQGSAHLIGIPHLEVHGDSAVATGYSQLLRYDAEREVFTVWRVTANRWEMKRTAAGWRVQSRLNRLLDGSEEARALLRRGVTPDTFDMGGVAPDSSI